MSLTKKRPTTAKKTVASQANGRRSHGPATPEGREQIRAANVRHGFYSQAEDAALRALGEDAARDTAGKWDGGSGDCQTPP
jgi:hypothetical protein